MRTALLIDFGSTYTKVTAIDLTEKDILYTAQAPTTVDTDIMIGLKNALGKLGIKQKFESYEVRLACSSAAGGLKMVAVGLVPDLTAEAAKRAALGAGAIVLKVYSYKLNFQEIQEIEKLAPDIILVAGGTDGGEEATILHNAKNLAKCDRNVPFVIAGNKVVQGEAAQMLLDVGKEVYCTENVLPELDKLNVEPCRSIIRTVFMKRIVHAKGLDKAQTLIDNIIMPTPAAVLQAAQLLARGTDDEEGWGELIVVDPGGATTDVHSLADGKSTKAEVVLKGLPEPFAKRTVEGDLGMRYSVESLLDAAGLKKVSENIGIPGLDVAKAAKTLGAAVDQLPKGNDDYLIDEGLAKTAISLAVERHAGSIKTYHTPFGPSYVQYGKDLTQISRIIGTGGCLVYSRNPMKILQGALFDPNNPTQLKPQQPNLFLDSRYIMAAMGLLSEVKPDVALQILKKYIVQIEEK